MDKVNSLLLRWWFLLCTQVALGTVAYHFNFFHHLYREDTTRIGFFILGILILTSLWVGKKVHSLKFKWEGPEDAIDKKKIALYKDAAEGYLEQYPTEAEIRFDVVSIIIEKDETKIEYISNAF